MSRFVRPDLVTLAISGGDTLTVRKRLNAGEQREAYARMYVTGIDGSMRVNPLQSGIAMMVAYLVDWSLTDDEGAIVPIRGLSVAELEATLHNLDPESFTEIKQAIEAHEERMREEREREKKTPDGTNGAEATSPSRSGAGGALIGSVN